MNSAYKLFTMVVFAAALALVSTLVACGGSGAQTPPTCTLTMTCFVTNGFITVGVDPAYGMAITSVIDAAGNQYVNTVDRGREFQNAYQLDGLDEAENPTEAGASADGTGGTTSTTVIVSVNKVFPTMLQTVVHPAFWYPYNGALVSPDTVYKQITVGVEAENVFRWDVVVTTASDHTQAAMEPGAGYGPMLPNLYELQTDGSWALQPTAPAGASYYAPIIKASADGTQAIGLLSPISQYYDYMITAAPVDNWNCGWQRYTPFPAGTYNYTCYVAVGTLAAVEASVSALVAAGITAGP